MTDIDKVITCEDGSVLKLYSYVWRIVKEPDRIWKIRIPVYRNVKMNCYHRGLPSFLLPYKHYTVQTIQTAIDHETVLDCFSLPCDSSRLAWRDWYESIKLHLDKRLNQLESYVHSFLLCLGLKLPSSQDSMSSKLRSLFSFDIDVEDVSSDFYICDEGWLAIISFLLVTNDFCLSPLIVYLYPVGKGGIHMGLSIHSNDVLALFNLEEDRVESISIHNESNQAVVDVLLRADYPPCPSCGCADVKIKGYTLKHIRHGVLTDRNCILKYNARRYVCPVCKRTYYEHNPFVFGSMKISAMTVHNVLKDLKNYNETFSSVANRYHISPTSAASIFDSHVFMPRLPLPELMCWDETYAFHHKGENSKYVFTMLDFNTIEPVDILPSRRKDYLLRYFMAIPKEERNNVKMIATDMYAEYRYIIRSMFPNVLHAVDHYHVCQDLSRRTDAVRLRIMKSIPKTIHGTNQITDEYYLLKKFNWLIFKRPDSISAYEDEYGEKHTAELFDPNRIRKYNRKLNRYVNFYEIKEMIEAIHPDLKVAWQLKDDVTDFYTNNTYESAPQALNELMQKFNTCGVQEMIEFARLLRNWREEIINSFIIVKNSYKVDKDSGQVVMSAQHLNTGLLENRNSVIKCIKKNSTGYANWDRFRNRCLYILRKSALPMLNPIIPSKQKK